MCQLWVWPALPVSSWPEITLASSVFWFDGALVLPEWFCGGFFCLFCFLDLQCPQGCINLCPVAKAAQNKWHRAASHLSLHNHQITNEPFCSTPNTWLKPRGEKLGHLPHLQILLFLQHQTKWKPRKGETCTVLLVTMTMTDTGGLGVAVTSADGRGVAPLITAIEDPIAPESKCSVWGWPQLHSTDTPRYFIGTLWNNPVVVVFLFFSIVGVTTGSCIPCMLHPIRNREWNDSVLHWRITKSKCTAWKYNVLNNGMFT